MSIEGQTYLSLQNEVLEHQFSETKYRPLVKTWLNQAQRRAVIESEIRTQESSQTYSTESGVATYTLPTNFARLIDFFNTETHEILSPLDPKDYDSLPASTGRPSAYAVLGNSLTLYATPDGVYPLELRYWKLPADMSADSDTPEIPVQYHELLVAYAMRKAYLRENDYQAAQVWQQVWAEGILKMRGEVQHDTFDGPRQVAGTWGELANYPTVWWR